MRGKMLDSSKARDPATRRVRRAGVVLAVYWLVLFVATHWPGPPRLLAVQGSDKVAHLAAYAVLAFLLARCVALRRQLTLGRYGAVLLTVILYGAVDELLQPLSGRRTEFADWLADAVGALLGLIAFRLLVVVRGRR